LLTIHEFVVTSYLKYIPTPLLEDIIMSRCVPVIGAGFSRNADLPPGMDMPLWDKLGKKFADLIPNYEHYNALDSSRLSVTSFKRES
jgi:hypothetical protein